MALLGAFATATSVSFTTVLDGTSCDVRRHMTIDEAVPTCRIIILVEAVDDKARLYLSADLPASRRMVASDIESTSEYGRPWTTSSLPVCSAAS